MARFRLTNYGVPVGPWRATREEAAADQRDVEIGLEEVEVDDVGPVEAFVIEEDVGEPSDPDQDAG